MATSNGREVIQAKRAERCVECHQLVRYNENCVEVHGLLCHLRCAASLPRAAAIDACLRDAPAVVAEVEAQTGKPGLRRPRS